MRVYQGGSRPIAPVTVATHLVDAANTDRVVETLTLANDAFGGAARGADYRYELPVDELAPGEYLLRIVASTDTNTVERTMRFQIAN